MKTTTASNHRARMTTEIKDLFSKARIFGPTSQELTNSYITIRNSAKVPQWVKSYIAGVFDTLKDELYKQDLFYGWEVKGQILGNISSLPNYYEKNGLKPSDLSELVGKFYWCKDSKLFF